MFFKLPERTNYPAHHEKGADETDQDHGNRGNYQGASCYPYGSGKNPALTLVDVLGQCGKLVTGGANLALPAFPCGLGQAGILVQLLAVGIQHPFELQQLFRSGDGGERTFTFIESIFRHIELLLELQQGGRVVVEEQVLLLPAYLLDRHVQVVDRLAFHDMGLQEVQVGDYYSDKDQQGGLGKPVGGEDFAAQAGHRGGVTVPKLEVLHITTLLQPITTKTAAMCYTL